MRRALLVSLIATACWTSSVQAHNAGVLFWPYKQLSDLDIMVMGPAAYPSGTLWRRMIWRADHIVMFDVTPQPQRKPLTPNTELRADFFWAGVPRIRLPLLGGDAYAQHCALQTCADVSHFAQQPITEHVHIATVSVLR